MMHTRRPLRLILLVSVQLLVVAAMFAALAGVAQAAAKPTVKLAVTPATPKVGANITCTGAVRHQVAGHRIVKLWNTTGGKLTLMATLKTTKAGAYRMLLRAGASKVGTMTFQASYFDGTKNRRSPTETVTVGSYYPFTFINYDGSTTVINSYPQHIVVIDNPILGGDDVLRLGGNIIAMTSYGSFVSGDSGFDANGFPMYLHSYLKNATSLGFWVTPDYDAIAAAKPDLIIVSGQDAAVPGLIKMDVLASIAPVVISPGNNAPTNYDQLDMYLWQMQWQTAIFDAQNTYYYQVNKKWHELAAKLRKLAKGKTVSWITATSSSTFAQFSKWEPEPAAVWTAAGLKVQPLLSGGTNVNNFDGHVTSEQLSTEDLTKLTGHYLFVGSSDFTGANLTALEQDPLWSKIPAVKAGRVLALQDNATRGDAPFWGPTETLWDMQRMIDFFKTHK